MINNWWWALLLIVGLFKGPYFVLAASGDAGDVMFVLDASVSITGEQWHCEKTLVSQVVGAFNIAADSTRVGVVQFSSQVTEEFPLDQYSNKVSLQRAIDIITQRIGGSAFTQAIYYLANTSFTGAKGARPLSEGIPRIAVFMTDGGHNGGVPILDAVSALRTAGIESFAIGVGNAQNTQELVALTGQADRLILMDTCSSIDTTRDFLVESMRELMVECPMMAPTNGAVSPTGAVSYPNSVTFTCNPGYILAGADTATCQADGTWSNPVPTCTLVECPVVMAPTNGAVSPTGAVSYPNSVTFTCDTGYVLTGADTAMCQADGTWSNPVPTCTFESPSSPRPETPP